MKYKIDSLKFEYNSHKYSIIKIVYFKEELLSKKSKCLKIFRFRVNELVKIVSSNELKQASLNQT